MPGGSTLRPGSRPRRPDPQATDSPQKALRVSGGGGRMDRASAIQLASAATGRLARLGRGEKAGAEVSPMDRPPLRGHDLHNHSLA